MAALRRRSLLHGCRRSRRERMGPCRIPETSSVRKSLASLRSQPKADQLGQSTLRPHRQQGSPPMRSILRPARAAQLADAQRLPAALHVPGARYCASADCPAGDAAGGSTGRVDPPWVVSEGWQGFSGQNSFLEFGKVPYAAGENGGIRGEVIYASTRPFDDPSLLLHTSWTPDVPGVTINLYQEGTAPDGTTSLRLVDTTKTSSWDDWAQGFRSDGIPNMNCPGQYTAPTSTT